MRTRRRRRDDAAARSVRYGTANDGAHDWPKRRAAVPQYREIGVGRDDDRMAGEYSAIMVDTARFTILGSAAFWYSDTPEVPGSMHWGNRIARIATWVRLADRATGDTVRVYNTHWDHESQPSRERSADLLLERMRRDRSPTEGILVLGDFNSGTTMRRSGLRSRVGDGSVGLTDTCASIHPGERPIGTYHAFRGDSTGVKINAILASRDLLVLEAGIDLRKWGDLWASDHFAVWAVVA